MKLSSCQALPIAPRMLQALWLLCAVFAILQVPARPPAKQATYNSPQEAVDALVAAARTGNMADIAAALGPEGREVADCQAIPSPMPQRASVSSRPLKRNTRSMSTGDPTPRLSSGMMISHYPIPMVRGRGLALRHR